MSLSQWEKFTIIMAKSLPGKRRRSDGIYPAAEFHQRMIPQAVTPRERGLEHDKPERRLRRVS